MKHTLELYKENRYQILSENMLKVDKETVRRKIKKGREVLLCSCENAGRFGHSQICRHKRFFLYLPILMNLDYKIDNLILEYDAGQSLIKTEEGKRLVAQIINDLQDLKLCQ